MALSVHPAPISCLPERRRGCASLNYHFTSLTKICKPAEQLLYSLAYCTRNGKPLKTCQVLH